MPWLRGLDGRLRLVLDWRDPAVKRFFVLMLPVTLTLGLINVNAVIGMLFASRLIDPELAPAAIDKAFRLYMLPQGVFAVAVTTVLFPALSRLAARGDRTGFARTLDAGLRQIAFLLVPAGVVSIVLAEPIVRLVYQRGAFDPSQTTVVAGALAAFSAGLVFNGWMLLLNRAFYSLQNSWIPTLVACCNLVLNIVLYTLLYHVGVWGIPLAVSIANLVGAALLFTLLRPRVPTLPSDRSPGRCFAIPVRPSCSRRPPTARGGCSTTGWERESPVSSSLSAARSSSAGLAYLGVVPRAAGEGARRVATVATRARERLTAYGPGAHPQLLDHRAHRPWQVDARRSCPPAHRHGQRA